MAVESGFRVSYFFPPSVMLIWNLAQSLDNTSYAWMILQLRDFKALPVVLVFHLKKKKKNENWDKHRFVYLTQFLT